jgi:hypothetical protein
VVAALLLLVVIVEFYSVWRALFIAIHNGCVTSIRDIQSLTTRQESTVCSSFNQRPLFALDHPKPPVFIRPASGISGPLGLPPFPPLDGKGAIPEGGRSFG